MPAPSWEKPGDFLSTVDFATLATFTRSTGQVIADVPGIFDDAVMNVETGEYDMAAGIPRFTCTFASVAMLKRHDTAVIDGRNFALAHDPRPDGTGWAVVEMSEDFPETVGAFD